MNKSLWRLSVVVPNAAEDAVTELLSNVLCAPCSAYHELETGLSTVSAFIEHERIFKEARHRLAEGLERVKQCGLLAKMPRVLCKKLKREDWAESWKRHFNPLEISDRLLVKPSWSRRKAKKGQAVVILDPGLSFGTGNHPTTAYCLNEVARAVHHDVPGAFLDAGTGSGILAIAAAKLGFSPIEAFDFDRDALAIAKTNAKRNKVESKIRFYRKDARRFHSRRKYAIICANLSTEILTQTMTSWAVCLAERGRLVLAGVLKTEFDTIILAAKKASFRLVRRRNESEWASGTFVRD